MLLIHYTNHDRDFLRLQGDYIFHPKLLPMRLSFRHYGTIQTCSARSDRGNKRRMTYADRDNVATASARVRVSAARIPSKGVFMTIVTLRRMKKSTHFKPVKVFVYPSKMMGGGEHAKIPCVQGFSFVVRPSTALQESSYTVPV